MAAFDEGVARLSRVIAGAAVRGRGWRQRVHAGLSAALEFLDAEPNWARLLLLEPPVATAAVSERRQLALRELAGALERETRRQTAAAAAFTPSPRLAAELVVGGVFSVACGQLLERQHRSFAALAPSLMSFISTSYAMVDARDELALPVRATYRTTRVLSAIAARPRSNNREIADAAGLRDEGQTSKLLSRLEQRGLAENVGLGAAYGEPNAWLLTASGERALNAVRRVSATGAGRPGGRVARGAA